MYAYGDSAVGSEVIPLRVESMVTQILNINLVTLALSLCALADDPLSRADYTALKPLLKNSFSTVYLDALFCSLIQEYKSVQHDYPPELSSAQLVCQALIFIF